MSKIEIRSLTNANVYLEDQNLAGRVAEVTLPEFKNVQVDHHALGMMSGAKLPTAGFEPAEAKYKWQSFYPEVLRRTGNPRKSVRFIVRGVLESYTDAGLDDEVPVIATLGGPISGTGFGAVKAKEGAAPEHTQAVWYYRLVINGEEMLLIDVLNNIHREAGVDMLSRARRILGV